MLSEIRRYWRWTRNRDYGSIDTPTGKTRVGLSPVLQLAEERETKAKRAKAAAHRSRARRAQNFNVQKEAAARLHPPAA